jgi:hypothetical protein
MEIDVHECSPATIYKSADAEESGLLQIGCGNFGLAALPLFKPPDGRDGEYPLAISSVKITNPD